jgi:hypothetical protein
MRLGLVFVDQDDDRGRIPKGRNEVLSAAVCAETNVSTSPLPQPAAERPAADAARPG